MAAITMIIMVINTVIFFTLIFLIEFFFFFALPGLRAAEGWCFFFSVLSRNLVAPSTCVAFPGNLLKLQKSFNRNE